MIKKLSVCFSFMFTSSLFATTEPAFRLSLPSRGILFTASEIASFKAPNILKMAESFVVRQKDGSCKIIDKKDLRPVEKAVRFESIALADTRSLVHPILYTAQNEEYKLLGIYARIDAPAIYTETDGALRKEISACLKKS